MNVQQKIEKWCRNERFVHYANERISEELVYAPNHRIDPEYEELDEAITWDNRYRPYDDLPYLSSATGQIAEKCQESKPPCLVDIRACNHAGRLHTAF